MISLKRYLDSNSGAAGAGLLASIVGAYQSALTAIGICAAKASPSARPDLQRRLTALGLELADATNPALIASTEARVSEELQQWGDLAQASLQQKTDDVKELLIVLARTAGTIASSDQRYAKRFDDFTARLEGIADLEDLTVLRASLVRTAAELKSYAEEMSQSAQQSVTQLQAEVAGYQAKLEEAEQTASRDALTGLWNRSRIEAHIDNRIDFGRRFSVALIDLDGFKTVNDQFGHGAGDDVLKQFSDDLKSNSRPTDHVGRWGGDEFVIVLDCPRADAKAHIERIEQWVLGDYVIERVNGGRHKVRLEASIGVAEWKPGMTRRALIAEADAAMYLCKGARR